MDVVLTLAAVAALGLVALVLTSAFAVEAWREREFIRLGARAALAAIAGVVVFYAGTFAFVVWHEHDYTRCGLTPRRPVHPGSTGYRMRWEYTPPGWVCVYTDRSGRVVAERRP